jgi:hypothetical protein
VPLNLNCIYISSAIVTKWLAHVQGMDLGRTMKRCHLYSSWATGKNFIVPFFSYDSSSYILIILYHFFQLGTDSHAPPPSRTRLRRYTAEISFSTCHSRSGLPKQKFRQAHHASRQWWYSTYIYCTISIDSAGGVTCDTVVAFRHSGHLRCDL